MTAHTRRTMLKIGTLAPMAALMPASVLSATASPFTEAAIVPCAAKAVTPAWGWWAGWGGEGRFSAGPFATRDEALYAGTGAGDFEIIEAIQGHPDLRVTGDDILELIDGRNEDHHDPDGDATIFPYTISKEAEQDLGRVVSAAIAAWVKRHNVEVRGYLFAETRNAEFVPDERDAVIAAPASDPTP